MSMHGLLKLHHAAQNQAACKDYENLEKFLREQGHDDLIAPVPPNASWRKLDKLARKVMASAMERGVVFPDVYGETRFAYLKDSSAKENRSHRR